MRIVTWAARGGGGGGMKTFFMENIKMKFQMNIKFRSYRYF